MYLLFMLIGSLLVLVGGAIPEPFLGGVGAGTFATAFIWFANALPAREPSQPEGAETR
jgi:hypothetical protein